MIITNNCHKVIYLWKSHRFKINSPLPHLDFLPILIQSHPRNWSDTWAWWRHSYWLKKSVKTFVFLQFTSRSHQIILLTRPPFDWPWHYKLTLISIYLTDLFHQGPFSANKTWKGPTVPQKCTYSPPRTRHPAISPFHTLVEVFTQMSVFTVLVQYGVGTLNGSILSTRRFVPIVDYATHVHWEWTFPPPRIWFNLNYTFNFQFTQLAGNVIL
jgi:hypothetical protein